MKYFRMILLAAAAIIAGALILKVATYAGDLAKAPNWQPATQDDQVNQIPR